MDYLEKKERELVNYLPELTRKSDFKRFWMKKIKESNEVPLDAVLEKIDYPCELMDVYDLTFSGVDQTRIHGWYITPKNIKGKLKCLIHYHGFSGNRGYPSDYLQWIGLGLAVVAIDCRLQGGITGSNQAFTNGAAHNVASFGAIDKEEYYTKQLYLDAIRAVDFACSQEVIDCNGIIVEGGSQGGALASAVVGLDKRPALAMVDVPSNSNIQARIEGAHGSFSDLTEYIKKRPFDLQKVYDTTSYFDIMNMAEDMEAEIFASVGLLDPVCPAKCYFATYNRIKSKKQICLYPFNGHEGGHGVHNQKKLEFLREWLKDRV